jgi:PIN domain nuclease of toxin-antitoxin system
MMRLLLDTHVYLWWLKDSHLSQQTRSLIEKADEIYISSASIWEIAIKTKLKKLDADLNELVHAIPKNGFLDLPITNKHATCLCDLPDFHKDPFDRLLIAQAISEPLRFITSDKTLQQYSDLVEII